MLHFLYHENSKGLSSTTNRKSRENHTPVPVQARTHLWHSTLPSVPSMLLLAVITDLTLYLFPHYKIREAVHYVYGNTYVSSELIHIHTSKSLTMASNFLSFLVHSVSVFMASSKPEV